MVNYTGPLVVCISHGGLESEGQPCLHRGQGCIWTADHKSEAHRFLLMCCLDVKLRLHRKWTCGVVTSGAVWTVCHTCILFFELKIKCALVYTCAEGRIQYGVLGA